MPDNHPKQAHDDANGAPHDDHGSTPAAWSTVGIIIAAFVVAGIGLVSEVWWLVWVGAALMPVAVIVGVVMGSLGYGAERGTARAPASEAGPKEGAEQGATSPQANPSA